MSYDTPTKGHNMSKIFNRSLKITGEVRKIGTPSVREILVDKDGKTMFATGVTVPTDGDAGYAKGCIFVDTDASANAVFFVNEGSATSADFNVAAGEAAAATVYSSIGDPSANGSIAMAGYTGTYTSSTANWGGIIMSNTHSNPTTGANLLTLGYTADGDADAIFFVCKDNSSADAKFTIGLNGATTIAGNAAGTSALTLTAGDLTLTSGHLVMTSGNATLTSGNLTLTSGNMVMTSGNLTMTSGNLIVDAGEIRVSADNQKLTLGASDSTDSYIMFDATNLVFYDANLGATRTLTQLAGGGLVSPTITGDVTISDGKLNWTDAVDEVAGTWTFAGTTNNDISWSSAVTTANCLAITANALTSGSMVYLESSAAGMAGEYIRCYDGAADDFVVGANGAVTIAGNAAGTDAFTITAGDILLDDSDQNIIESEDGTTTTLLIDNKAGVIADNLAVLSLDAGGAMASGSNILRVAPTGTPNAGAIGIEFVGGAKAMTAVSIDADPTASDVVEINGGGALTDGLAVLAITNDGNLAAGGCDFLITMGGTPNADARAFEISAVKDAIAVYAESSAATDSAYQLLHSAGNLAAGKAVVLVTDGGTPAAENCYVGLFSFTGTATNTPRVLGVSATGKDVTGLYIDSDTTTQDATSGQIVLYNDNAGALGGSLTVHQNSASPVANDVLFQEVVYGEEATSSDTMQYTGIAHVAIATTDGAIVGGIYAQVAAGSAGASNMKNALQVYPTVTRIGHGDAASLVGSSGAYDLTISTNLTTSALTANEPKIVLTDGAAGDITITAGATSGKVVFASPIVRSSTETITAGTGGAIAVTTDVSLLETDAGGDAYTLADGVEGQYKTIIFKTDGGGDAVITPANLLGYTTITFSDVGEGCLLRFSGTEWAVISTFGGVIA